VRGGARFGTSRGSVLDRAGEEKRAVRTEKQSGAAKNVRGRCSARFLRKSKFPADGEDASVDAAGVWKKLRSNVRAGAVCADDKVAGRAKVVLKSSGDLRTRAIFEGDELLSELDDRLQTFEKNVAECDATDGKLVGHAIRR
jgi:hypothetical protein